MIKRIEQWVETGKQVGESLMFQVLATKPERIAHKRLQAIDGVLGSEVRSIVDVFREQVPSGYRKVTTNVLMLRLDLSNQGERNWLTNVRNGIDESLRAGNVTAVKHYNGILEAQCVVRPERRLDRVA